MRTGLVFFLAGLALTAPALAQTAATRDPDHIEAGAYAVDPLHTQVSFAASHLGFTTFRGRFDAASGTLQFDPKKPDASTFDVAVRAGSVDTPVREVTDQLKGERYLDARKFPKITFKSTRIVVTGPYEAEVTGDFTLHGVTKPLTLVATLHGAGMDPIFSKYTVGFELSGKIRRSDFGMKSDLSLVGDEVQLVISASFQRKT